MSNGFPTRFGFLTIPDNCRWHSDPPLLGFTEHRAYALLHLREQGPFMWLQSLEDAAVSFLLTEPQHFGLVYDEKQIQGVGGTKPVLLVMVILPQTPDEDIRAHSQAPLLFDTGRQSFHQIILERTPSAGPPSDPLATSPTVLHEHCLHLHRRGDDGFSQVGAA